MTDDFPFVYSEMERLIDEYVVGKNSERNREILKLRFLRGLSFPEIARIKKMSDKQIGRIIHRYGDPLLIKLSERL